MQTRFGLALVASLCTFGLASTVPGCGTPAGGPDAGGTPDAGPTFVDAGPVDAGPPPGEPIGTSCSGATEEDPQGNCALDLICAPFEYAVLSRRVDDVANNATCTKECTTSAECGATGAIDNVCVPLTQAGDGLCAQGCDPDADACGTGRTCVEITGVGDICVFTCETNAECSYGATCMGPANGPKTCDIERCPPAPGSCGTGRACYQVSAQLSACVDACPATACPAPLTCDTAKSTCEAPGGTYYTSCNQQTPCATPDAICVVTQSGATSGLCLQECTDTRLCGGEPEGGQCVLSIQYSGPNAPPNDTVCVIPCPAAPATCPTGSVCSQNFCLPPQGAPPP